jgi:hypothetical protein
MALGKSTGADALRRTALEEPATFVRVAASLLPEEMKLQSSTESLSDEELDRRLAQTLAALGLRLASDDEVTDASPRTH